MLKATHKRRATTLSKTLLTAGLLGGAALSTLGAGSAQAATGWNTHPPAGVQCTFGVVNGCDFTGSDPTPNVPVPGGDKILTLLEQSGLMINDTIAFNKQVSAWEVTFDPSLDISATNNPIGYIKYKIDITDLAQFFSTAELSTNIGGTLTDPYSINKEFYTDDTFTTLIPAWTLNSPPTPVAGSIGGQTIYVKDAWNIPSGSGVIINNFNNNYTQTDRVPGPLPLFGAGAAFGFSRRIRNRIKGARLA
jgi:hypothetical protein